MEILVNYWAVLVATIAAYAVGAIWYSPILFSKTWSVELKRAPGQMVSSGFTPTAAMILEFVATLVMTYVLAHFIVLVNANTVALALQLGFWAWLGFIAMYSLSGVWFEGRSWKLFVINVGHRLIAILVACAILGAWH